MPSDQEPAIHRAIGYLLLQERHSISCLPYWVESYVSGSRRSEQNFGKIREYYPDVYWPGDTDWDHLEFALKHEGLNLPFLRAWLPRIAPGPMQAYVAERPRSEYRRRTWYLYEEITGRVLDIPDVTTGNNVQLLDPEMYYVGTPVRSPRHRVLNNLPGTIAFSPMVRRTGSLRRFEAERLEEQCRKFVAEIPPEVYQRALDYLYAKETKSSYEIERETPDQKRSQKFVQALRDASTNDCLRKEALVALQKIIVDPRFANEGWRDDQNYVGRSRGPGDEDVHFISPKPEDIAALMEDYLIASRRILESDIHPVVAAAMIAFPFVFLHPFTDGNGRSHRFLIHYVLSRRQFAPEGVIFPVSATMLHRMPEYDRSLESFSKPLIPLIDYELDSRSALTVLNETANFYRHIDCTQIAETLFSFVKETIEKELPAEIRYLQQYDVSRARMREIVDLPNRHADLFIRYCRQNGGRLAKARRKEREFAPLSDKEIAALEAAVREGFDLEQKEN